MIEIGLWVSHEPVELVSLHIVDFDHSLKDSIEGKNLTSQNVVHLLVGYCIFLLCIGAGASTSSSIEVVWVGVSGRAHRCGVEN